MTRPVATRRVIYIPGYDPFHPRRYRELYRSESAAQARVSGYEISQTAPPEDGPYSWRVTSDQDGQRVQSRIEVLVWSDIVKASMSNSILGTYGQMGRTAWIYLRSGALWRLARMRKGPVIAALYPVLALLAQLGVALLAGAGAAWVCAALGGARALGAVLMAAVAWGVLRWWRSLDARTFVYYLMHDFAHSAQGRGAYPPELEARIGDFADHIAEALNSDADEVLVVGHSSGAHLAVSALADLIRAGRVPAQGPALALLSLGQVVPMVSFLPRATRLRADLLCLSQSDALSWVDVTAPGDGCAFALCDPVAVTGLATPAQRGPLVLSAAFTQTLSSARWAELRWRFFRLHFQYLCAFDRPGDYDYFRITAGPLSLGDRYAGRAPSASRITRALSGHRSTDMPQEPR